MAKCAAPPPSAGTDGAWDEGPEPLLDVAWCGRGPSGASDARGGAWGAPASPVGRGLNTLTPRCLPVDRRPQDKTESTASPLHVAPRRQEPVTADTAAPRSEQRPHHLEGDDEDDVDDGEGGEHAEHGGPRRATPPTPRPPPPPLRRRRRRWRARWAAARCAPVASEPPAPSARGRRSDRWATPVRRQAPRRTAASRARAGGGGGGAGGWRASSATASAKRSSSSSELKKPTEMRSASTAATVRVMAKTRRDSSSRSSSGVQPWTRNETRVAIRSCGVTSVTPGTAARRAAVGRAVPAPP